MSLSSTVAEIAGQNAAMREMLDVIREHEFLKEALAARGVTTAPAVNSMAAIIEVVATRYDISVAELRGAGRARYVAWPRQEAMWLMRQVTFADGSPRFSLPQIGRFFGRDHTTVLHATRAHEARRALAQQERAA